MFKDRKDAGRKLGKALEKYQDQNPLVLAIPRGGVEVGYEAAAHLDAAFSILIPRKLPLPDNPEGGFGAVAEDGTTYLIAGIQYHLSEAKIARIIEEQKQEMQRRIQVLRKGEPLPPIKDRLVILVDDGIATGSTMTVSVRLCKNQGAGRIVVAAPVAGQETIQAFQKQVDDLVVLESPPFFRAVAQVYQNWYDVSDAEVLSILYGDKASALVDKKGGVG